MLPCHIAAPTGDRCPRLLHLRRGVATVARASFVKVSSCRHLHGYDHVYRVRTFPQQEGHQEQQKYANLQKEFDKSERKNSELEKALLESERELEKAKALAEHYWKMLSDVQRDTEESLKIANSNRVQHTSGR